MISRRCRRLGRRNCSSRIMRKGWIGSRRRRSRSVSATDWSSTWSGARRCTRRSMRTTRYWFGPRHETIRSTTSSIHSQPVPKMRLSRTMIRFWSYPASSTTKLKGCASTIPCSTGHSCTMARTCNKIWSESSSAYEKRSQSTWDRPQNPASTGSSTNKGE